MTIEEMEIAREIHKALLHCMNNSCCRNCEFRNDTPMSFCKAEYIAKAISEKYQPKLPEDSVREEYEKLYYKGYNNGKQIAEKFYKPLIKAETHKEMAEMILSEYKVHCSMGGSKETFEKWFCREFGLEIKE